MIPFCVNKVSFENFVTKLISLYVHGSFWKIKNYNYNEQNFLINNNNIDIFSEVTDKNNKMHLACKQAFAFFCRREKTTSARF